MRVYLLPPADQDALLETVGLHSKYIQKKCAHVKHHGLLHTMLQAAETGCSVGHQC